MSEEFEVGDWVRWESHSRRNRSVKEGVIVKRVPEGERPPAEYTGSDVEVTERAHFDGVAKTLAGLGEPVRYITHKYGGGYSRNRDSYIVAVPYGVEENRWRLYWPWVSKLRKVEP